jgi:hypothetical protein
LRFRVRVEVSGFEVSGFEVSGFEVQALMFKL